MSEGPFSGVAAYIFFGAELWFLFCWVFDGNARNICVG